MASQHNGVSAVCSAVCSGADQRKHQSSAWLVFVRGIHRSPVDSPSQRANNAENVSIWWRHHAYVALLDEILCLFWVFSYITTKYPAYAAQSAPVAWHGPDVRINAIASLCTTEPLHRFLHTTVLCPIICAHNCVPCFVPSLLLVDPCHSIARNLHGLYSQSSKTSYRKISWSLGSENFGFKLF